MLYYLILFIALILANAEKYFQIDDIPIENFSFDHEDLQSDAVDIELMPRFQRSFPISNDDPKDFFFSRPLYEDSDLDASRDIPRPGGFSGYSEEGPGGSDRRKKREAMQSTIVRLDGTGMKSIVKRLGKPLELRVIDPESVTELPEGTSVSALEEDVTETSNFLINDFIRFKRAAVTEKPDDVTRIKDMMKKIDEENKSKANTSEINPKSMVEEVPTPYTEKLVMEPLGEDKESMRGIRGATKEQWVKQEYPVRRNELDDNSPSSLERDNVRAPRVHFVTQGMSESAPRPEYNRYDREARSRNLNRELAHNLARDPYRDMDYYQPRYTRNYAPPAYQSFRQDRNLNYDRDPRDPWDDHPPRSRYFEYPERNYDNINNYNSYSGKKGRQRRIIYYASLPEVNRSPPNDDLRDRYDYRDRGRYEGSFFRPNPDYQLRRPYDKARYEENDSRKPPHPLKVSTDVSVRDVKKNPERRVYSEVDRNRYPQNTPYQNERM